MERAKAPAPAPAMDMFADDTGQKDTDDKNGDAEDDKVQEKSLGKLWCVSAISSLLFSFLIF